MTLGEPRRWVGHALPRKEENRLLRGRGKFADDIKLRDMLYLRFIRSPYAHANILSIDVSAAEAVPGVICTLTGAEIVPLTQPFIEIGPDPFAKIKDYPLAVSKARYQGEPVAAVVATSPAIADDAAEVVQVEYEALDPLVDDSRLLADALRRAGVEAELLVYPDGPHAFVQMHVLDMAADAVGKICAFARRHVGLDGAA